MIIDKLNFIKTSEVCPEQYDVFDQKGNMVGYVRLRWGALSCAYPDFGGKMIYSASVGCGWDGSFKSENQRQFFLKTIAKRINDEIQSASKSMDKESE